MIKFIIIFFKVYSNLFLGNNINAITPVIPVRATTADTIRFFCKANLFLINTKTNSANITDSIHADAEK